MSPLENLKPFSPVCDSLLCFGHPLVLGEEVEEKVMPFMLLLPHPEIILNPTKGGGAVTSKHRQFEGDYYAAATQMPYGHLFTTYY